MHVDAVARQLHRQQVRATRPRQAGQFPRPAEEKNWVDGPVPTVEGLADRAKRVIRAIVAGMRGGGKQHDVPGARRKRVDRLVTLRPDG